MCGRYALHASPEVIALQFALGAPPGIEARYNICPGSEVLGVHAARDGRRIDARYRWGLVPHWAKDPSIGQKLANARGESLAEKPAFRDAFRQARCLVPASGYYEWRTVAGIKQPWYLKPSDTALFALAGLAAAWCGPAGVLHSVALVTTVPNDLAARIHDRMPLIIDSEDYAAWLDPGNDDLAALERLVRPYPAGRMQAHPVSPRVNAPANDDAALIEPLPGGPAQRDLL